MLLNAEMFQQALMYGKQSQLECNMEEVFDSSNQESDMILPQFIFHNQDNPMEALLGIPETINFETHTQESTVIDKENESATTSSPPAHNMVKQVPPAPVMSQNVHQFVQERSDPVNKKKERK